MSQGSIASAPKLFISYAWTSPDHIERVVALATSLREDGVDVILDKWDLKPGHDSLHFMEQIVTDEAVTKVLLICDENYARKANRRQGGAGIESQIISPKVYESTSQEKFAAVVFELDSDGRPYLPEFMSSRIYFDFSSSEGETASYEQVVRWIFDKPFHVKPAVGKPPAFLLSDKEALIPIPRRVTRHRLGDGSEQQAADATQTIQSIGIEAKNLILTLQGKPDQDEEVFERIQSLSGLREVVYAAFRDLTRKGDTSSFDEVQKFFEGFFSLWDWSPAGGSYSRWDNDVLKFFAHDCFVSFTAICLDASKFKELSGFLSQPYFIQQRDEPTGKVETYPEFRPYLESLESRNKRLGLNRLSFHADVLSSSHEHSSVTFSQFMQADFVLYLLGLIDPKRDWYPISAIYLSRSYGALPVFARATSRSYYTRLEPLLGISAEGLKEVVTQNLSQGKGLRLDYRELPIARLANFDQLAQLP